MKSSAKPCLLLLTWILCLLGSSLAQSQSHISPRLMSKEPPSSQEGDSSAVALEDGRQIQSPLPKDDLPTTFYYYAVPSQHSVVTVNSAGREIRIYAKRIKIDIGSLAKPDIQPLDQKSAEFISSKDNSEGKAFVTVPPLADSDVTIVAVSVSFKDIEAEEQLEKAFSILASSQIGSIIPGTPFKGSVAEDRYVYFMVNIMRSDCTLLISLTNSDEGKSDLVLAYGQDSRPTASDNRFASISNTKTKVIEINNMDIYPLDSISGVWVVGVYGNTASTFTLTAVEEDQKMISIQPETPLKMSLEASSSVNVKFLLAFKRHLQITFTKNSGEFDLYVTSITQDQDLATNIPSEAKNKWKISNSDLQSIINIPMQDPLACVSCLYLIHIEAKAPGGFSLLVDQEDKFLPIQNGFRYSGQLKPQESMAYVLKTSNKTEEAQLNVDLEGTELDIFVAHNPTVNATNYLGKEILTSENSSKIIQLKKLSGNPPKVWDGKREIRSERDFFYIIFSNPTDENLSYSFPTAIKTSRTVLFDTDEPKPFDFAPYDKFSFLYYSNRKDIPISLKITLCVNLEEAVEGTQEALDLALRQGQILKARYWTDNHFEGEGQEIAMEAKSVPVVKNDAWHIILECDFGIKGQKGKYMIEAANLWGFNMQAAVSISMFRESNSLAILRKSQNFQGTISSSDFVGKNEKMFDMLLVSPGKWYFWVYTCSSSVDLKLENGKKDAGFRALPNGGSYFYQETIEDKPLEAREDRFKSMRLNINDLRDDIFIYSAVINEREFMNFELSENPSKLDVSYKYRDDGGLSRVFVKFSPLKFQDTLSTDKVRYEIGSLVDYSDEYDYKCWDYWSDYWTDYWTDHHLEFPIDHKEQITMTLLVYPDAKQFIAIRAFIIHESQTIKFITYPIAHVNTKNLLWWYILMIVASIVACIIVIIVIIMGWRYHRKVRASGSRSANQGEGAEIRRNQQRRGYEVFDREEGNANANANERGSHEVVGTDS